MTDDADDDLPPELRAEFRLRLRRDAQRLAALRDGLAAADERAAAALALTADPRWAELDRLVHGLAGAAGVFGFREVGSAAEDVERLTGLSAEVIAAADTECRRLALAAVERLQLVLSEAERRSEAEGPA